MINNRLKDLCAMNFNKNLQITHDDSPKGRSHNHLNYLCFF